MLRVQQTMLQVQQAMIRVQQAMLQVQQAMLREINNKAKLSPAELELELELGLSLVIIETQVPDNGQLFLIIDAKSCGKEMYCKKFSILWGPISLFVLLFLKKFFGTPFWVFGSLTRFLRPCKKCYTIRVCNIYKKQSCNPTIFFVNNFRYFRLL